MTAILFALATGGFWGEHAGHWQARHLPDMETCERARPSVEADMRGRGYTGIATECRSVTERGS